MISDEGSRHSRLMGRVAATWNFNAKADACWAILSDPMRRNREWDPEPFFRTGEKDVERVLSLLDKLHVTVRRGTALDFGCGIGRLTLALAKRFESTIGVDVSEEMVARRTSTSRR